MRMDGTKIFDGACRREGLGEGIVRIESARAERAVLLRNDMRNIVSVDPGHRGAGFDRKRGRIEGEIGDLYLGIGGK